MQYEHTQTAYYRAAAGRGDRPEPAQRRLRRRAAAPRPASARASAWLREHNRAAELRDRRAPRDPARRPRARASPRRTPPPSRRLGGRAVLAPNGVDDEFFAVARPRRRGPRAVLRALRLRGQPARRSSASSPRAGRECAALRPNARLALAGGGLATAAAGARRRRRRPRPRRRPARRACATARAVIVPIWEGGGTRLKVLEALAAGAGRGLDPARRLRHRLRPRPARAAGRVARGRSRPHSHRAGRSRRSTLGRDGRMLAERFRWKEALSGASGVLLGSDARAPGSPSDSGSTGMMADEVDWGTIPHTTKANPPQGGDAKPRDPWSGVSRATERETACEHLDEGARWRCWPPWSLCQPRRRRPAPVGHFRFAIDTQRSHRRLLRHRGAQRRRDPAELPGAADAAAQGGQPEPQGPDVQEPLRA